jgi:hypothetical protein
MTAIMLAETRAVAAGAVAVVVAKRVHLAPTFA